MNNVSITEPHSHRPEGSFVWDPDYHNSALKGLSSSLQTGRVAELDWDLQVLKHERNIVKSQKRRASQQIEDPYTQITSSLRQQKDSLLEEVRTQPGKA